MAIKNITTDFAGEVGVLPRLVRIQTTDSFSDITTANYLKSAEAMGYTFYPNDAFLIAYGTNSATTQLFTATISGGDITLEPSAGDVVLPVSTGHIAVFTNASGSIGDDAAIAINAGDIQAGISGQSGAFISYPGNPSTGTLQLLAQSNNADFFVKIVNSSHGQSTTYRINDVGAGSGWIMNCTHSTDPGANLVSFDVTIGQAALASAGSVTLYASSGSNQYKIRYLQANSGGTNFSGGGGNRLLQITDNTTVYSVIPAASLQTLANAQWGVTALPNPASAAINTSTTAGASLVAKYSGGTTDYTAGSVVISGILERVA